MGGSSTTVLGTAGCGQPGINTSTSPPSVSMAPANAESNANLSAKMAGSGKSSSKTPRWPPAVS
eukprot:8928824-Lingulodinium_polyedra.AAC.1